MAAKTLCTHGRALIRYVISGKQKPALVQIASLSTTTSSHTLSTPDPVTLTNTKQTLTREEDNWKCRVDLAAAYQLCAHLGFAEGIDNHLTLRAPCEQKDGEVMLINPYGLHWSQVTASTLIGVDFRTGYTVEGHGEVMPTAFCIHRAIHGARSGDGSNCVMHTHQPYATALSCLKDPRLMMLHQNSTRFHGKIAYDQEFDGIADMDDNINEGARMTHAFKNKEVMLMGNHGITAIGPTVAYAFNSLYFFERACEFQIKAMSTGRELLEIPDDKVEKMTKTWPKYDYSIPQFLDAMKEVLIEKGSKFMT